MTVRDTSFRVVTIDNHLDNHDTVPYQVNTARNASSGWFQTARPRQATTNSTRLLCVGISLLQQRWSIPRRGR